MARFFPGILVAIAVASAIHAAVFSVPDGDVAALKSAITASNANGEDDIIELATNGTYTLTAVDTSFIGLPVMTSDAGRNVTIHGNGATIQCTTAEDATPFGVFGVGGGANVTIFALVIKQSSASAISTGVGAVLNLQSCALIGNSSEDSGAVVNSGSLMATDTTFSDNVGVFGGAIGNFAGQIILKRCTFSGNVASDGGAIYMEALDGAAALAVQDSTFTLNSASDIGGGAIYVEAYRHNVTTNIRGSTFDRNSNGIGGALCIISEEFSFMLTTLTSCTFFQNSASQGGAIFDEGNGNGNSFSDVRLINCTLSGNSAFDAGAIYNDSAGGSASVTLVNTLIQAGGANATFAGISSLGHNLCSDSANGYLNGPGDQTNTGPKLDPNGLQDNGGLTKTISLQANSPAINAADDGNAPHRDQRGYFRTGQSDIGAFELSGGLVGASNIARNGNDTVVSAEVVGGQTYRLERKLHLTDAQWQVIPNVSDLVATDNDTESISDPGAILIGKAFYRLSLLQQSVLSRR